MAFTKPIFALGLDVPNCSFQLPGDTGGLAAGWAVATGSPATYAYFGDGRTGRPRTQYLYTASPTTYEIASAPSAPYKLAQNASTKIFGALDCKSAQTGNTIKLRIRWYNSAGTALGSYVDLVSVTTPTDGLTTATVTTTPPSGAVYAKISVQVTHSTAGGSYVALAFAGAGCWDGATSGYFQLSKYLSSEQTRGGFLDLDRSLSRTPVGMVRAEDRARRCRLSQVVCGIPVIPLTDAAQLEKLYHCNMGRNWEASSYAGSGNPQGGSWPVLLVPGMTGLPSAMLCDLTGGWGLAPDETWGRVDPPYYQGALEFTERG